MDKLIELLQQIQDLAGVGVDALKQASGDKGGKPADAGGPPPEAKPQGGDQGQPMHEGGKPPMGQ